MEGWRGQDDNVLVNGVFKGGGARGIAYVGALQAVIDQGTWFKSVAGSSAGALTAALIAAGLGPEELRIASEMLLKSVLHIRSLGAAVRTGSGGLVSTSGLRNALERLLQDHVGNSAEDGPVTFEMLYRRTGIALFVVTMDLNTRRPIVFCAGLTPDAAVSNAVIASCSIPTFFSPTRASFVDRRQQVHQLVDGGAWANYPMFVYRDSEFREWLRTHAGDAFVEQGLSGRTIGFVLDDEVRVSPASRILFPKGLTGDVRFDLGPAQTSLSLPSSLAYRLLGGWFTRLALVVALAAWLTQGVAALPHMLQSVDVWALRNVPNGVLALLPPILVGALFIAIALVLGALLIGIVLVGPAISRTTLPSISAALSPATSVPPWVGSDPELMVCRVPAGHLTTILGFLSKDRTRTAAIINARTAVAGQLAPPDVFSDENRDQAVEPEWIDNESKALKYLRARPKGLRTLVISLLMALMLGVVIQALVFDANDDGRWGFRGIVAAALLLVATVLWVKKSNKLAALRARYRDLPAPLPGMKRATACAALGVFMILIAVSTIAVLPPANPTSSAVIEKSAYTSSDDRVTSQGQTVSPEVGSHIYDFRVTSDDAPAGSRRFLMSNQRLFVGEAVVVEWHSEASNVPILKLESRSSALGESYSVAIMAAVAGVLLLLVANQARKWKRGNARLARLQVSQDAAG